MYVLHLLALGLTWLLAAAAFGGFVVSAWVYLVLRTRGVTRQERRCGQIAAGVFLAGMLLSIGTFIGALGLQLWNDQSILAAIAPTLARAAELGDGQPLAEVRRVLIFDQATQNRSQSNAGLRPDLQAAVGGEMTILVVGAAYDAPQHRGVLPITVVRWPQNEAVGRYLVRTDHGIDISSLDLRAKVFGNDKIVADWVNGLPARSRGDGPDMADVATPSGKVTGEPASVPFELPKDLSSTQVLPGLWYEDPSWDIAGIHRHYTMTFNSDFTVNVEDPGGRQVGKWSLDSEHFVRIIFATGEFADQPSLVGLLAPDKKSLAFTTNIFDRRSQPRTYTYLTTKSK